MSEAIVKEVMLGLRSGKDGLNFASPPSFLEARIAALGSLDEKRAAVAALASLGYVLAEQQKAPAASRTLMTVVDRISQRISAQESGR